ncbi:MAG: hypothetical protein HZB41_09270 [Ignavibacteriae bacterium]|nr:hypothetical protein [Ignavibacteriota bacterium]
MKKLRVVVIAFLFMNCLVLISQETTENKFKKTGKTNINHFNTTITISPIHLIMPVVELMGEFALKPTVSIALIGGLGTYEGFSVYEIGGQLNFYLTGNFDQGMQAGIEILHASVSGEVQNISGVGQGLSIGPFIGYKGAYDFGLSIDLQLGIGIMTARAEAGGSTASANATAPFLNFNLGWSF